MVWAVSDFNSFVDSTIIMVWYDRIQSVLFQLFCRFYSWLMPQSRLVQHNFNSFVDSTDAEPSSMIQSGAINFNSFVDSTGGAVNGDGEECGGFQLFCRFCAGKRK